MTTEPFAPSLDPFLIRPLVEAALREDLRSGDLTTEALIPPELSGRATMNFRVAGTVAGLQLAQTAFEMLDASAKVELLAHDGQGVEAKTSVLRVECSGRALLSAERVALNFVQRLSGIATLTARYAREIEGTKARLADTRKTTPLLRLVEKYAVRCGGGKNHRYALDDLILIKDNHIALCGGVEAAIERAKARIGHSVKIEVECDTLDQVGRAANAGADILLLDNMPPDVLKQAVEIVAGRSLCEASGGINLTTIRSVAETGVDLISVGALTHGATNLDIGLDVEL
ncbi:putative nicotinate-nucleotide pyrophosphorylase [carboxylating] [Abditibacteriota bacterium]|nr:putative nicotinate-nucleotide pyrophosphorylase [carboxylating] [Abditibacteriota bacterium]